MIRKIVILQILLSTSLVGMAQNTTVTTLDALNPKPVFIGGGIMLGGGSGYFQLGLNPELVQAYNDYIDLGIAVNLYYANYHTTTISNADYKLTNLQLGLGSFVRVWPLEQFFLQLQPEYNWTFSNTKVLAEGLSGNTKVSAPSLLAGIGYGRRFLNGFSYFSVMYDLIDSQQSPYRMGQTSPQPIFRGGFGIPIHFSRKQARK
ncbi:MAG: hypothetical protein RL377_773 [Bacteroidota bacterium]|jgi:hypothetical protein